MAAGSDDEQGGGDRTPVRAGSPSPLRESERAETTPATPPPRLSEEENVGAGSGDEEEGDGDEEEEEEPRLKYARVTGSVGGVYRSGDATSNFTLSGDKMIIGTHNGNVNVLSLPSFQALRVYHVHSAAITAVSVSPRISYTTALRADGGTRSHVSEKPGLARLPTDLGNAPASSPRTPKQPSAVPLTISNSIYIATSSVDGNVCVASLVDAKDVLLRNFGRPVNAVQLSPEYKSDRSYLSGGLAGNLVLTVGGQKGVSAKANTSGAAAAAQSWLGTIGLATSNGKDTILHSGEGTINSIKWSLTGKFVVWVNEQGIKLMRTHIQLGEDQEYAWRRIAHIDRPKRSKWQDMAAVWKARCEWVDTSSLEPDDEDAQAVDSSKLGPFENGKVNRRPKPETLVVGWGDTVWVLSVKPAAPLTGKETGDRVIGSASIVHQLLFDDCIVSGLSLYTPSLLLVLAYRTRDDSVKPAASSAESTPRRGVHNRQTGLQPELRLINAITKEEVDVDTLTMSRFESLSAADYHLGTMYVPAAPAVAPSQRGALESLAGIPGGIWDASINATRLFSSAASVRSNTGSGDNVSSPPPSTIKSPGPLRREQNIPHPESASPGLKIYIQSPYDCVLAVKRDLGDHLGWLLERDRYEEAWNLIDEHPEVAVSTSKEASILSDETPPTPTKRQETLAEFFADSQGRGSQASVSGKMRANEQSNAEREKRRVGELWLRQLVAAKEWKRAGEVAGKVLGASSRWEHWVWTFAQAGRFDEITPYIPSQQLQHPLPSTVYELVLGHYISKDRVRVKELLEIWDPDLFDVRSVIAAIENKLATEEVTESTVEGGERGRDWRILVDSLAKLYLADARPKDALRCYIQIQNADAAMDLIREYRLLPSVSDDIPNFLLLRITKDQMESASLGELEEVCSENISLLVDEAYQGTVPPKTVVEQLQKKGAPFKPFLFYYLRALWKGQGTAAIGTSDEEYITAAKRRKQERMETEGHALVDEFADLAVELFAEYDRPLLMTYIKSSRSYSFEKATAVCEKRSYYPELVYLLSQTGETKRALNLIITGLGDVSMAIAFTKEQGDLELWNDLLDYSMDKPRFIRGLLEEVGTAIDPITLVKRIPEGLEIEGLREGIGRMVREYEIQTSISEGVAKVLRSEVASGMDALRKGRAKAVRFEVVHEKDPEQIEVFVEKAQGTKENGVQPTLERAAETEQAEGRVHEVAPGQCAGCGKVFLVDEKETLIGFACGHVFHLSCLLAKIDDPETVAAAERLQSALAADAASGDDDTSHSVGAKVAHAHIIRNAVRGGCTICTIIQDGH